MHIRIKQVGIFLVLAASGAGFIIYLDLRADFMESKKALESQKDLTQLEPLKK